MASIVRTLTSLAAFACIAMESARFKSLHTLAAYRDEAGRLDRQKNHMLWPPKPATPALIRWLNVGFQASRSSPSQKYIVQKSMVAHETGAKISNYGV